MTKLLFVCLGNICRSPTAEAVMNARIESAGCADEFVVDSAGTISAHQGNPADSRMRRHASNRGYTLTSRSRPVTASDFSGFDLILAMDESNLEDLKQMSPPGHDPSNIHLFLDWHPDPDLTEVPDPYYGGAKGFEDVLDLVETACDNLLNDLQSRT